MGPAVQGAHGPEDEGGLPPLDELLVLAGPLAMGQAGEMDGFEEVGLAMAVGGRQEVDAGVEGDVAAGVVAEVDQAQAVEMQGLGLPGEGRNLANSGLPGPA